MFEADAVAGRSQSKSLSNGHNSTPNFPPPKTDKPRPHICATCTRSFARLEHLKRHERSHTKEKPFACPECTRCFARRDLLLRHQQKLHMTALPSARQRGSRRESTSGAAPGATTRVRKNSMANSGPGTSAAASMRPRANTISHVDNATLGMLAAANSSASRQQSGAALNGLSNIAGLHGVGGTQPRGMSTAAGNHGNTHVLPKLETKHHGIDIGASLRTAPAIGGFGGDVDMESFWFGASSTINPAQLHYSNSPHIGSFEPHSPYHQGFTNPASIDNDGGFAWLNTFDNQMSFNNDFSEQAIDGSSPSAMSSGSPEDMNEMVIDGASHTVNSSGPWASSAMSQASFVPSYSMDLSGPPFPDLYPTGQLSPKSLNAPVGGLNDQYFSPPLPQTPFSMLPGMSNHYFQPQMNVPSETPSNSTASISSSNRQSSVTSVSTDSITDATRQALLASLTQPSAHGLSGLKTSQPQVSSPLSPGASARSRSVSNVPLPSTYDLQRYVAAYIQYFHPHLPFLHIPSLSFDSPEFTSNLRVSSGQISVGQSGIVGGGGSLVLAMAAIGALYEYDFTASKDLFEMAKKMIQLYLEERRKADMSAALSGAHNSTETSAQNTPLWLVQAMLLNVIYGQNCGDKILAGIASTHCAALVNLARAADLAKSWPDLPVGQEQFAQVKQEDGYSVREEPNTIQWKQLASHGTIDVQNEWYRWKLGEERKRTLYAVFILSSLCVSAYNHAPALMNSEIGLELPCDEALWSADSAASWRSMGGSVFAGQRSLSFASALSSLLTASQRPNQWSQRLPHISDQSNYIVDNLPESDIKPSTFGCLVLINALHNYIWETRQRHMGRQWTTQETESMHAHIEPALRAWLAAWASHPDHSVERPNPFGASSLSADCIPYLDLAYVRLFVNLGRSKEAFFKRDFGAMAEELAQGAEIVQHADYSPDSSSTDSAAVSSTTGSSPDADALSIKIEDQPMSGSPRQDQCSNLTSGRYSKRERHLRKAAVYAVNALAMSDALGVSFADFTSRELPLQSGLCAFDCAQVLAEWVSTVQQRVGRYLGVLGKDAIDFSQVPAIMLLEDEDFKLFERIDHLLVNAEAKLADSRSMISVTPTIHANCPRMTECGYGSKILLVHARMFGQAAVWPSKLTSIFQS
ncbi:hypothetical protein ACLMJK_000848 [Lecanora helva]